MEKLLLAPFLLASLFSFGGELKANPNSRYELPDPRSSLSESQSNSNNVWYLLNQNAIHERKYGPSNFDAFEELMITSFDENDACKRFASEEKRWITQIDLGRWEDGKIRYVHFAKCIKGIRENEANYLLRIASIKMKENPQPKGGPLRIDPDQIEYSSFNTLYFKDLTQCNLAKLKLDIWFASLESKLRSNNRFRRFVRYSTKCFSKT